MPQSRRSTFLEVLTLTRRITQSRSHGLWVEGAELSSRPRKQAHQGSPRAPGSSVSASPPPDRMHRAGGVGPNRLPWGALASGRCSGGGGPPGGGVSGSSAPGMSGWGRGSSFTCLPRIHSLIPSLTHPFIHLPCSFPPTALAYRQVFWYLLPPPPTILSPLPSSPSPGFVSLPRLWGPCLVCCLAPPPWLQRRLQATLSRVTGSRFSCLKMTPAVAVGTQEKGTHTCARMHTHGHTHVCGETS